MINHIIVDGPDAVGKSTLAEFVREKWGLNSLHSDGHCKNDFEYHNSLLEYDEPTFYDRFMAGEYVYPKIYGRDAKLTITEMTKLFDKIIETNSVYIIMNTTDTNILIDRLKERNELNYLDEIEQQVQLFRDFAYIFESYFENHSNFIYFDINQEGAYDKLYRKVLDIVEGN